MRQEQDAFTLLHEGNIRDPQYDLIHEAVEDQLKVNQAALDMINLRTRPTEGIVDFYLGKDYPKAEGREMVKEASRIYNDRMQSVMARVARSQEVLDDMEQQAAYYAENGYETLCTRSNHLQEILSALYGSMNIQPHQLCSDYSALIPLTGQEVRKLRRLLEERTMQLRRLRTNAADVLLNRYPTHPYALSDVTSSSSH